MQRARVKKEREEEMVFIGMVRESKQFAIFMPPPTIVGRGHRVFRSSLRPSVNTFSCDAIYLQLLEEFQWNLTQIFIMWVGIAEKGFQGQRSKVKVIARPNALFRQRRDSCQLTTVCPSIVHLAEAWRSMVWHRGCSVHHAFTMYHLQQQIPEW